MSQGQRLGDYIIGQTIGQVRSSDSAVGMRPVGRSPGVALARPHPPFPSLPAHSPTTTQAGRGLSGGRGAAHRHGRARGHEDPG